MICQGTKSYVRCGIRAANELSIKVEVHQSSLLPPSLLVTAMDADTRDNQKASLWNMVYADGILLERVERQTLRDGVCRWKVGLKQYGFKLNIERIKCMDLGPKNSWFNELWWTAAHSGKPQIFGLLPKWASQNSVVEITKVHRNPAWRKGFAKAEIENLLHGNPISCNIWLKIFTHDQERRSTCQRNWNKNAVVMLTRETSRTYHKLLSGSSPELQESKASSAKNFLVTSWEGTNAT